MQNLKTFDSTIKYYDLQMSLDNLQSAPQYPLPNGYKFVFWDCDDCLSDWLNIHISTGEFASLKDAKATFDDFYTDIKDEIDIRVIFISDSNGEKIATATLSPCIDDNNVGIIDWLGISKKYQGKKLSKPLLSKIVEIAKNFNLNKIVLHTQTNSWLAAKIYLDFGFEPLNTKDVVGWNILKTITNHPKLIAFDNVKENEIFDTLALNIKTELSKMHNNFDFNIWYINGRNDVYVHENDKYFEYKFYENGKNLIKIK